MTINYRELCRRYELDGPQHTVAHLSEALDEGHLRPDDFSLRDMAEALVPDGREWVRLFDPRGGGTSLVEASEAVDVTAFRNITGQVISAKILEAYNHSAFVMSRLVSNIPTRLDGEVIPGVTRPDGEIDEVAPGMPYPHMGFGEDYIETPATTKRGFIVPVTKEAIFFDRTNLVLTRAAEVGEVLGLDKEKRLLDLAFGFANNYKWRGTSYDTYQATTPWVNLLSSNELVDWTNVDAAELAYVGSGSETTTTVANPLGDYTVRESRLAYRRALAAGVSAGDAKKIWLIGDFRRAFAYMENWPITVAQAPVGSEAEFTSDIVLRFKASERGAAAVLNPRHVVKCLG